VRWLSGGPTLGTLCRAMFMAYDSQNTKKALGGMSEIVRLYRYRSLLGSMRAFPYSDDRELLGDIMRFGADVQVLAPPALRSKVQKSFLEAAAKYV